LCHYIAIKGQISTFESMRITAVGVTLIILLPDAQVTQFLRRVSGYQQVT
jgi:hypothetical protein